MFSADAQQFAALGGFAFVIVFLVVWSVVWKALALWKSARAGSKPWFVIFLLVNTAGILEIIYLYFLSKPSAPAAPEIKG